MKSDPHVYDVFPNSLTGYELHLGTKIFSTKSSIQKIVNNYQTFQLPIPGFDLNLLYN